MTNLVHIACRFEMFPLRMELVAPLLLALIGVVAHGADANKDPLFPTESVLHLFNNITEEHFPNGDQIKEVVTLPAPNAIKNLVS